MTGRPRVTLHRGDALEVVATFAEASFDACLTDPPYGLNFMGREWDHGVPSAEVWREVLRALRPGASLFAFGGTRTYHRLACAVEDAGFEIRDSVMVPGVVWAYGSGFPKSLDVSKAIDKAAGEEREVIGEKGGRYASPKQDFRGGRHHAGSDTQKTDLFNAVTAPATPEAAQWEGYGTALKPAHEPVVWAMKPLAGTFARNALEHGVAGLDVDRGRVGTGKNVPASGSGRNSPSCYGEMAPRRPDVDSGFNPNIGRWPANLILCHLPECREAGTKRVASDGHHPKSRGTGGLGTSGHTGQSDLAERKAGTEEVPAWECAEGCPVLALDRASGELTSGLMRGGTRRAAQDEPGSVCYGVYGGDATKGDTPADSGTASRFFQQCSWEPGEFEERLTYFAKAATAERMVDGERLLHPTMKPLALTTYLAKLLLPPPRQDGQPRRLLVPYSGVGSEILGACRAGWDEVVGIELDPDGDGWVERSARRIEADAPLLNQVEVRQSSRGINHPTPEATP